MTKDRDAEIAALIRREVGKVKHDAQMCNWIPNSPQWSRAFGELAGMYRILQLIDPDPYDADPAAWARACVGEKQSLTRTFHPVDPWP